MRLPRPQTRNARVVSRPNISLGYLAYARAATQAALVPPARQMQLSLYLSHILCFP